MLRPLNNIENFYLFLPVSIVNYCEISTNSGFSRPNFEHALRKLQQNHDLLRAKVGECDPPRPTKVCAVPLPQKALVASDDPIPLRWSVSPDDQFPFEILTSECNEKLTWTARVHVIEHSSSNASSTRKYSIILLADHAFFDGMGVASLLNELLYWLGHPGNAPETPNRSLELYDYVPPAAHEAPLNTDIPPAFIHLPPRPKEGVPEAPNPPRSDAVHHVFDEEASASFFARCKSEGVTVGAFMGAAGSLGVLALNMRQPETSKDCRDGATLVTNLTVNWRPYLDSFPAFPQPSSPPPHPLTHCINASGAISIVTPNVALGEDGHVSSRALWDLARLHLREQRRLLSDGHVFTNIHEVDLILSEARMPALPSLFLSNIGRVPVATEYPIEGAPGDVIRVANYGVVVGYSGSTPNILLLTYTFAGRLTVSASFTDPPLPLSSARFVVDHIVDSVLRMR